ncbi:hypothetical protein VPAG_00033 [Vibrio phage douglas 12A4]|uniref:hypothetical protein n=1 Tax=Vibrio phage douglas 12A4 TaxID=573171 RepID=UPI0002C089B6|nr:hypothetical protein VPAG_00033 [Vibrio phage douglas 12A4]AGG58069.1 hypothetical protein VPAG_00033 [Vibrio phage douglas 12A4]
MDQTLLTAFKKVMAMNNKTQGNKAKIEALRQKYWGITNGVITSKTVQVFAKVYSSKGVYHA